MAEELPQEALDAVDDPEGHPVQTDNGQDTNESQDPALLPEGSVTCG